MKIITVVSGKKSLVEFLNAVDGRRFETGNAFREAMAGKDGALKVDAHRNGFGDHDDERLESNPDRVVAMDVSDCPDLKIKLREYSFEMDDMIEDLAHDLAIVEQREFFAYAS